VGAVTLTSPVHPDRLCGVLKPVQLQLYTLHTHSEVPFTCQRLVGLRLQSLICWVLHRIKEGPHISGAIINMFSFPNFLPVLTKTATEFRCSGETPAGFCQARPQGMCRKQTKPLSSVL
jgi:hypothetical protein